MSPRPQTWKEKRSEDQGRLEAYKAAAEAGPVDWRDLRDRAHAEGAATREQLEAWLAKYPEHTNAVLWRGVLARGFFTMAEWREAAAATKELLARRETEIEPAPPAQGELF